MAIDSHYIAAFNIEDVLLDKDTGAPLSGGIVTFEQANQPGTLKAVWQITNTSGNYTYTQLPNPMILSSIGTFEDSLGNPVIPYFLPYDGSFNIEYYRVIVTSSEGVEQFVRDPVPYIPQAGGSTEILSLISNEISNPQFADVLFNTDSSSYTYNFNTVSSKVVPLAPDWDLIVSSPGVGTVTVSQVTPAGQLNILTNPAAILRISSAGLSSLRLRQRIYGSPNLWGNGYLAASFVATTSSGSPVDLSLYYSQSAGLVVDQLIETATLTSASYAAYPASLLILVSTNPNEYPDAYIDIYFDIPLSVQVDITSVMIAFTGETSINNIVYDQTSYERQVDQLFHYYKPQLDFKPLPSYLIGWDFILNPAQFNGRTVAAQAIGANKCFYAWDQTLIFQTVNSGVSISENTLNGAIALTAAATGQLAMFQYLPQSAARGILINRLSTMITTATLNAPINATVSLWYTTNANVPITTNDAFFTGLDANGKPTGAVAGWHEVPRSLGDATFISPVYPENTLAGYQNIALNGWELDDYTVAGTATFFAIVIGTESITSGNQIGFKSVSLNAGDIPTIPAPQSADEVLRQCQYYYEKSYDIGVIPGTADTNGVKFALNEIVLNGGNDILYLQSFALDFVQTKRTNTFAFKFYAPDGTADEIQAGIYRNGTARAGTNPVNFNVNTYYNAQYGGQNRVFMNCGNTAMPQITIGLGQSGDEGKVFYHYVIDVRIGIN